MEYLHSAEGEAGEDAGDHRDYFDGAHGECVMVVMAEIITAASPGPSLTVEHLHCYGNYDSVHFCSTAITTDPYIFTTDPYIFTIAP